MRSRLERCATIVEAVLVLVSLLTSVAGGVTLTSTFGFDHQLIRHRYAPIRIELDGLDAPLDGRMVVKQYAGSDPSEPVTLLHEIANGRLENGVYWATLPAYDAVLPVLVQLIDARGEVIASSSESVRQSARGLPFAVVVGEPLALDGTESIVSAAELPQDWWAYDPVRSLWLTTPMVDQAKWNALGEWVVSGGSLVLFSGSDFYQWDSPIIRDLLPLSNPSVRKTADGTFVLTGTPRAGSQVLLTKEGEPLLVRIQRGAGHVSLVTVRPRDLSDVDVQRLSARIPTARRLATVDRLAERLLNESRVLRPLYAFAPIIVLVVVAAFVGSHRCARRRFGVALAVLLLVTAAAAVSSGLYVNRIGTVAYKYIMNTSLSIATSFAMNIDSYAFFSLDSTQVAIAHSRRGFPIQAESWISVRELYGLVSALDETTLLLPARTRRFVHTCGTRESDWRLLVSETERTFLVENLSGLEVNAAMLFVDGLFYSIPITPERSLSPQFAFSDLRRVSASAMTREEFALYTQVAEWLPLSETTWLLTYSESVEVRNDAEMPAKVSLVRMNVVEGERSS